MVTGGGKLRTFKQIRKSVLNLLNIWSADVEKSTPGSELHVDFSKGVSTDRLSDIYTDSEIIGMLEATDFFILFIWFPRFWEQLYIFCVV